MTIEQAQADLQKAAEKRAATQREYEAAKDRLEQAQYAEQNAVLNVAYAGWEKRYARLLKLEKQLERAQDIQARLSYVKMSLADERRTFETGEAEDIEHTGDRIQKLVRRMVELQADLRNCLEKTA